VTAIVYVDTGPCTEAVLSNITRLLPDTRRRVLVGHRQPKVRHTLRTMLEAHHCAIVEAADGEEALAELARRRFDLAILELDLPKYDAVTLVQMHRVLLINQQSRIDPPAIVLLLTAEGRANATLVDQLFSFGVTVIDSDSGSVTERLLEAVLSIPRISLD